MYRTKTIAVDHGNRNIKTENQIFTSGLVESEYGAALGDFLSYNKKYYTLSQQRIPYMRDKTKDDRFFILTLFGIGMELELEGQRPRNEITKVNLPVGLPPAHYGSLYKKFERYFKTRRNHSVFLQKKQLFCYNRGCGLPIHRTMQQP